MLCSMKGLLREAEEDGRAVGAFSVGNMEMVIGAVKAAEKMNAPIILQIAEVRLLHSPLIYMGPMMVEAAKNAKVPIAVHFDHGLTLHVLEQAINMGFTSVMFDGSKHTLEENIMKTKEAAALAAQYGVTLEAELGVVGGSEDGKEANDIRYTDPREAKIFNDRTGIDALAVAIGNAHGNYIGEPKLNFDVLKEIHSNTSIPLVLHGGSGISRRGFQKSIDAGIRKINIATASFTSLTNAAKEYLSSGEKVNYFNLNEAMVHHVYLTISEYIDIFNNQK